jgi:hypothetical protein
VRTFREHFAHTLLWLTHYDAALVGSNSPLLIDEAELARRMAAPAVGADLRKVMMGSATDLLSYFVMGTDGMARFSRDGIVNTDDRLYLELGPSPSPPRQGRTSAPCPPSARAFPTWHPPRSRWLGRSSGGAGISSGRPAAPRTRSWPSSSGASQGIPDSPER